MTTSLTSQIALGAADGADSYLKASFHQIAREREYFWSHWVGMSLKSNPSATELAPPHFDILFGHDSELTRAVVAESMDGLVVVKFLHGFLEILAASTNSRAAEEVAREVSGKFARPVEPGTTQVQMWSATTHGTGVRRHRIGTEKWPLISRNYPSQTRHSLGALMGMQRPRQGGRLLLWHGAPGTGKTRALSSLITEWRNWCHTSIVTDPDRFFSDPGYITDVLTSSLSEDYDEDRWHLIVAEDADEYLRPQARQTSQGALGRLLNVTDGLLGQTSNCLVLLTTNEDASVIDPALTRPGRCLSRIEFDRFTPEQARAWLPAGSRGPSYPTTLAELYGSGGKYL